MSSPAEEKALRVSALKASGTLQKKIAEARNSLTKMLKKGVMNQEIACSMHRMLTELRGYKISEIEKCFNELWKTFTRELLTACNESLSTLTPPISFNFELFPGPEEALAAAEAAAEAEKKRKQLMLERQIKSREDDDRREQIGLAEFVLPIMTLIDIKIKEKRALQAQKYEKRIEKMGKDFLLRNPDHPYTIKKRAADQALIKKMQDEKIALLQKKSNEKSDQFTTFIDRYISILNCDYDSCGCGGGENCKSC